MKNKSDELDYIASVMKTKKDEDGKMKYKNKALNIKNNNLDNLNDYRLGANKVHKNITLDENIVNWINKEAEEFNLNFSETINQILKFCYENSKKKI